MGGNIYNTLTLESFKDLCLDSQRIKKLASMLHVHSVNFAAKLVHTRRALSSTVINSHQEPVSDQACTPPDPHWFFLSFSWWTSFTVLGTNVAFTPCEIFFFFLFSSGNWLARNKQVPRAVGDCVEASVVACINVLGPFFG